MPVPCLPVDSATSCSSHSAEGGDLVGQHQGELVPPGERRRAEHGAQPQPGVGAGGRTDGPSAHGRLGARSSRPGHVDAEERAGHERRSTTARSSGRRCRAGSRTRPGTGAPAARAASSVPGVGDGDEAAPVAAGALPEVGQLAAGLDAWCPTSRPRRRGSGSRPSSSLDPARWRPGRWCRARAGPGGEAPRRCGPAPRGTGSSRPCPSTTACGQAVARGRHGDAVELGEARP